MTANNATNNQKALKELYASALLNARPYLEEVNPRKLGFIIETGCGELIEVPKPSIEKRFCYADHLEDANDKCRAVCTKEDFFIAENTRDIRQTIEDLENGVNYWIVPENPYSPMVCKLYRTLRYTDDKRAALSYALPEEDRARALEVYRMVLADFEKRLRSYVKRYGLKNVYSWTYWADA